MHSFMCHNNVISYYVNTKHVLLAHNYYYLSIKCTIETVILFLLGNKNFVDQPTKNFVYKKLLKCIYT